MARGLIVAARHPRTRSGARVCHGRTDVPLAECAQAGAERLLAELAEPIERIICSPLSRALDVAREVAWRTGAPLHADNRLTDQDFGSWESRAWSALPPDDVQAWEADPVGYSPGGGESGIVMLRRVRRAWTRIGSSEDTTLVLTHTGPIQCLLHIAAGLPLANALRRGVAYGEVVRFEGGLQ